MKKIIAIVLSVLVLAGLTSLPAFAEEAEERTNYLTQTWTADFFDGEITVTEEEGVNVYTYIPSAKLSWFSPGLSIFNDIKQMIGDSSGVTLTLSFDIKGVFENPGSVVELATLYRAVNPKSGGLSFPETQIADWDGNGYSWTEIARDTLEGDLAFAQEWGGNCYCKFDPMTVEVKADEWTHYETEPMYIAAADLDTSLYSDWVFVFDNFDYNNNFKGLQLRNTAIYKYGNTKPTEAPTEVPEEPTEAPATQAPVNTKAPEKATDEPVNDPTAVPKDNATKAPAEETKAGGPNIGLIIGIICVLVVIIAVVIVLLLKKKKK